MDLNERKHHNENGDWNWFNWWAGCGMMSNFYVYVIFENVIKNNPQIRTICELGQAKGGFSVGLSNIAFAYDKRMYSVEIEDQLTPECKRLLNQLQCRTIITDCFSPEFIDDFKEGLSFVGWHKDVKAQNRQTIPIEVRYKPMYLICDGGDKAREFKEFVPLLPSGSVVSVHDYGTEFLDEHWQIYADKLEPFMPEDWQRHNVQMCTFKIK